MSDYAPTIAVDFDGVIHAYTQGWRNGEIYDPPVEGALWGLHTLMTRYAVFVHTSRDRFQVMNWLQQHGFDAITLQDEKTHVFWNTMGKVLVTNRKLGALAYIDDRGYQFHSWNEVVENFMGEVYINLPPGTVFNQHRELRHRNEELQSQIQKLAEFIIDDVPGEPSQGEGAVDTAIHIIKNLMRRVEESEDALEELEEALERTSKELWNTSGELATAQNKLAIKTNKEKAE